MNVNEGILLFDTTNVRVIDGVIDDIFVILLVVFLPSLWGTFFIAKRVSTHAIKPFTKVSEVFLSDNYSLLEAKQVIEEIKEYDLRQMAKELITALEQKSLILEQQITFNQGMAHELRTPLQIMDHSVELMQSSDESLKNKPSFRRLARSIIRMKRISEALLWLTAPSSEKQSTNVKTVVERILLESDELLSTHGIDVQITSNQSLYIPMPEVTFELIALNLLTNVVHHCQVPENEKYWKIEIDKNYVCFSNPKLIGTVVSRHKSEPRFGLGLMMIKKLTEKFAVNLKLEDEPAHYKVTLFI
jgi:signal transduction histidine kinase